MLTCSVFNQRLRVRGVAYGPPFPLLIYSQVFCGVAMETMGLSGLCRELCEIGVGTGVTPSLSLDQCVRVLHGGRNSVSTLPRPQPPGCVLVSSSDPPGSSGLLLVSSSDPPGEL